MLNSKEGGLRLHTDTVFSAQKSQTKVGERNNKTEYCRTLESMDEQ